MTKRDALIKCRDMWKWLAEHPEATKLDYFIQNKIEPIPVSECDPARH